MAKIKRLIAFGDSYTYGDELINPQESSWPALFSKKCNIDLLNLGCSAFSNDLILEKVLDQSYTKNDLVIVCFSIINRFGFQDNDGWFTTIPGSINSIRESVTKSLLATIDLDWTYKRWLNQIIYLQNYLAYNKINYLFCIANHNHVDHIYYNEKYKHLSKLVNKKYFIGWPNLTFDELVRKEPHGKFGHPLEEGHAMFCQFLIDNATQLFAFK